MKRAAHSYYVAQGPSPEPGPRQRPVPIATRSQFRRYLEENRAYLITTNTEERQPIFVDPRLCAEVVENLAFYRDRGDFSLHAYVVMPDHIHLVITPRNAELPDVMRNLKSYCAKQIRETTGISGSVWQSRFHDRAIPNEVQFRQAIAYVHNNPVEAGLADSDEDYEYSSARVYAGWTDVAIGIDMPDGSRLGP